MIRNKDYSLIYNPNHTGITSNTTLTASLNPSLKRKVRRLILLPVGLPYLKKILNTRQELNSSTIVSIMSSTTAKKTPTNSITRSITRYQSIISDMQLLDQLNTLSDSDPIATERSLVNKTEKKKKKSCRLLNNQESSVLKWSHPYKLFELSTKSDTSG